MGFLADWRCHGGGNRLLKKNYWRSSLEGNGSGGRENDKIMVPPSKMEFPPYDDRRMRLNGCKNVRIISMIKEYTMMIRKFAKPHSS